MSAPVTDNEPENASDDSSAEDGPQHRVPTWPSGGRSYSGPVSKRPFSRFDYFFRNTY